MQRTRLTDSIPYLLLIALTLLFPAVNVGAEPLAPVPAVSVSATRHGNLSDVVGDESTNSGITHMADGKDAVANRIIVRYRDGVSPSERDRTADSHCHAGRRYTARDRSSDPGAQIVTIPATLSVDRASRHTALTPAFCMRNPITSGMPRTCQTIRVSERNGTWQR